MRRLDHWVRPSPVDVVTIVEAPWYDDGVATASDARVVVSSKWLAGARDRASSRALVVGLSKLYWNRGIASGVVSAGVRDYVATRVIHDQFSGNHYFTVDLLGGFATHVVRPVMLTRNAHDERPPVRRFPEASHDPAVRRIVDALFTLERYIGWPTLQYGITVWLSSDAPTDDVASLTASLERASGRNLQWFTAAAFDAGRQFDYAIQDLSNGGDVDGWRDVTVTVGRLGDAVFPVDVDVVFSDGTRVRERWDGHDSNITYRYRSRSDAVAAVVDPDLVLLLDSDRRNNARVLRTKTHIAGLRWTMQWATWLQNVAMTAAAFI